jgi:hypothetical protein
MYRSAANAALRVTIDGFSGDYTMGEAATLFEGLVKGYGFSKDNPRFGFTMRSNDFKSGGVRTYKVCLSNPESIEPPREYILKKRRVRARPGAAPGESEKGDDEEEAEDEVREGDTGPSGQAGSSSQAIKRSRR